MNKEKTKKIQAKKIHGKNNNQRKKQVSNFNYYDIIGLVIIIFLGIIIYSNSFDCSFHFDDKGRIVENTNIRNLSDFKAIWNYGKPRFVPYFTFALNYHFGNLDVWGYHLFNLIIHLINACLVWWLTMLIFSSPNIKNLPIARQSKAIAFFTALLFVSHPLATQSVTYIVQRMASLAALFYFLSLALYIKARLLDKSHPSKYVLFACSLISALIAIFTKENALTLPFAIILFDLFFLQKKMPSINLKDYRVVLFLFAIFSFILIVILFFSFKILKPLTPDEHNDFKTITSMNYLFTEFRVIIKYLQLLVLPINQNLDYDFQISNNFFELRTMLSFLFLLALIILAIFLFNKNRIVSFCIFWFFLTLTIESSFIQIGRAHV